MFESILINLLEKNKDRIDWEYLLLNSNAIYLINYNKISINKRVKNYILL
jgi:hypothetical protein